MVRAYTKTMSEAQLEANRRNAQKAGRPKGKISGEVIAARRIVAKTVQEACQSDELRHIAILNEIANSPNNPLLHASVRFPCS